MQLLDSAELIQKVLEKIPGDIKTKLFPANYFQTIKRAKDLLNKKFYVILPSSSAPTEYKSGNGIGSLNKYALEIFYILGFDGIITLPEGPLLKCNYNNQVEYDTSPFNPLGGLGEHLAQIERLLSNDWKNLLSEEDLVKAFGRETQSRKVNYSHIETISGILDLAFERFSHLDPSDKLVEEYREFVNSQEFIENDAIYNLLSTKYNTHSFEEWHNFAEEKVKKEAEFDQKIFSELQSGDFEKAQKRLNEIQTNYVEDLERYKFGQFFLFTERKILNDYAKKIGIEIIGNLKVAPPLQRLWDHPDCFLKDYRMGAAPERWRNQETGEIEEVEQRWGAPVFIPLNLSANELQRKLVREFFELNDGGILDHAVKGSLNEYVYEPLTEETGKGSRLCCSPFDERLKEYSLVNSEQVDTSKNSYDPEYIKENEISDSLVESFAEPFKEIYNSVLIEKNIKPSNFILETLGILTKTSQKVFELVEKEFGFVVMTPFAFSDYSFNHPYNFQNAKGLGLTNTHDTETINYRADRMTEEEMSSQAKGIIKQAFQNDSSFKFSLLEELETKPKEVYKKLKQAEPWFAPNTIASAIPFVELTGDDPINFPGEIGIWSKESPNTKVWISKMIDPWNEIYNALMNQSGYQIAYSLALGILSRFPEEKDLIDELFSISNAIPGYPPSGPGCL
ncbi:MAG: 4-alpha-glucanotransferase [Candidatus Caenarcaniphilales bacterium]|nr:4-alpha-glucanotransferase [Candidatus Caenarcaniphilales bacterium]